MKHERGAATAELLVAFFPALLIFLGIWQLSELLVGKLLVERASSAAARAAAVVLPDDPAFYDNVPVHAYEGQRRRDVELAAGMILAISPHFTSNFTVNVTGAEGGFRIIEAAVDAEFRCILGGLHCGGAGSRRLQATASHAYHGAEYSYELSFDATGALLGSQCEEPGSGGRSGDDSRSRNLGGNGGRSDPGTDAGGNGAVAGADGGGNAGRGGSDGASCSRPPPVNDGKLANSCVLCTVAAMLNSQVSKLLEEMNLGGIWDEDGVSGGDIHTLLQQAGLTSSGTTPARSMRGDDALEQAYDFMLRSKEDTFLFAVSGTFSAHAVVAMKWGPPGRQKISIVDYSVEPPMTLSEADVLLMFTSMGIDAAHPQKHSPVIVHPADASWRRVRTLQYALDCPEPVSPTLRLRAERNIALNQIEWELQDLEDEVERISGITPTSSAEAVKLWTDVEIASARAEELQKEAERIASPRARRLQARIEQVRQELEEM